MQKSITAALISVFALFTAGIMLFLFAAGFNDVLMDIDENGGIVFNQKYSKHYSKHVEFDSSGTTKLIINTAYCSIELVSRQDLVGQSEDAEDVVYFSLEARTVNLWGTRSAELALGTADTEVKLDTWLMGSAGISLFEKYLLVVAVPASYTGALEINTTGQDITFNMPASQFVSVRLNLGKGSALGNLAGANII